MILLIDNYDSFTYNLYQLISELGFNVKVIRNNKITLDEILELNPQAIVLSPGPKMPSEAGICLEIIQQLSMNFPILGVCLGHQAIAQAFGGKVIRSEEIVHGKSTFVFHSRQSVYSKMPLPFIAGRYHSLIVEKESLPECLEITAEDKNGLVMGIKHKTLPCHGIQFHPESILSPEGKTLLSEFFREYSVETLAC